MIIIFSKLVAAKSIRKYYFQFNITVHFETISLDSRKLNDNSQLMDIND